MRLDRNPKYKEDYVKFMSYNFQEGDAEKSTNISRDDNTWHIPLHGVYHPRKNCGSF